MRSSNSYQHHSDQPLEPLSGSIERITFHSEETGFCVLRVKVRNIRELVTVVGNAAHVFIGEYVECQGNWVNDRSYGLQFKAQHLKTVPPSTLEGITKYLASGMVKGIGPYFAKKLVKAFGERVFDIIEHHPKKLATLPGIGKKRTAMITTAWSDQKNIRDIMVFLQSHGVGTARAVRIYKTYGEQAVAKVQANPYRLALDIHGIGFKTADMIAQRLGIAPDSLIRAQAGVRHVLQELAHNGHCAAFSDDLAAKSAELLGIPPKLAIEAMQSEIKAENLVAETINNKPAIYLQALYKAETLVANHILRLQQAPVPWGSINDKIAIPWVEQQTKIKLSPSQQTAITKALHSKVMIITGGPGVGKTTIVNSIIKIIRAKGLAVSLCAPTGRAAKRLSETTNLQAKTIHRLLEFDPRTRGFKHNSEYPLATDLVVVDEASMLDIVLMYNLLKAIPGHAGLLLVGDVDQLPSVGPGMVLADLINSQTIATVRLTEIFRQAANSAIIVNAHRINQGLMPSPNPTIGTTDFYMIAAQTTEEIHAKIIEVVTTRIPNKFGFNAINDIQVLAPMNRGAIGTRSLNIDLQKALNHQSEPKIRRFGWTFAPGDKVLQNVNNYDKDVFNGDIGTIRSIDLETGVLNIEFDGRLVIYETTDLDEISLAYAISIHKAQGSEYPVVVIPLATAHYMMLARNLIYTGVTRGKRLVIIIGQPQALAMAVKNIRQEKRLTNLQAKLA